MTIDEVLAGQEYPKRLVFKGVSTAVFEAGGRYHLVFASGKSWRTVPFAMHGHMEAFQMMVNELIPEYWDALSAVSREIPSK